MKPPRILVDLNIAFNNGYCGIGNENRLLFKLLSDMPHVQADGLLTSSSNYSIFSTYKQPKSKLAAVAQANYFFLEKLQHEPALKNKMLAALKLYPFYLLKKKRFDLYDLDPMFGDVVWRHTFQKTLAAEDKQSILQNKFYFSDLSGKHASIASYFNRNYQLNTPEHDIALFLEPTAITVSPQTKKVVRYHDAIPVTAPDFTGTRYSKRVLNLLNLCGKDSYYICNSEPTRTALLSINPALEARTFMVPCALATNYQPVSDFARLKQILMTRLSSQLVQPDQLPVIRARIDAMTELNYIVNLATLDPKKNHITLIRAWEQLNYQYPGKVKLIISANPGWMSEEAQNLMRTHIEMGNIIHVANLASDEMPYVISHAKAFVFPSYVEGFGLPPLEAMQCGTPTIVSDIAAHRWVMGDASLFCDPYSVDSLAEAIAKIAYQTDAEPLRQTLISKGHEQVRKYSLSTLAPQWSDVLERIRQL